MGTRHVSVSTMISQLEGLLGTDDLNDWQHGFVENMVKAASAPSGTTTLTGKQLETLEQLWRRHFA